VVLGVKLLKLSSDSDPDHNLIKVGTSSHNDAQVNSHCYFQYNFMIEVCAYPNPTQD
jgi:hypothetical protein